jgi:hypothetical protein
MIFAMAPATAELWLQIESAGEAANRSGTNATATGSKQRNRGRQADKTKKKTNWPLAPIKNYAWQSSVNNHACDQRLAA